MESPFLRFHNMNVRVEKIIWIPGAIGCGSVSRDFKDFCDDVIDPDVKPPVIPFLEKYYIQDETFDANVINDIAEEFIANDMTGYLVQLSTPINTLNRDGKTYSYSWGYYKSQWVYVQSLDDLMQQIEHWKAQ